jgi:hypothetical protein
MPEDVSAKDRARFVFQGTVQRLRAATMRLVANTSNTIVVLVENVIRGPEICKDFVGKQITVYVDDAQAFRASQTGVFYTNVRTFGESLAAQLLAFDELRPGSAPQVALAAHEDPVEALRRHQVNQRVGSADLVISGKITAVRVMDEETAASGSVHAAAEAEGPRMQPVSEHAPLWQEAVVEVNSVLKGTHPGRTALIRFPASTDVRWYKAPKLSPGREGVFILHTNETQRAARGMLAAAGAAPSSGEEPVFTALDPQDFQPAEEAERIQHVASTIQPTP